MRAEFFAYSLFSLEKLLRGLQPAEGVNRPESGDSNRLQNEAVKSGRRKKRSYEAENFEGANHTQCPQYAGQPRDKTRRGQHKRHRHDRWPGGILAAGHRALCRARLTPATVVFTSRSRRVLRGGWGRRGILVFRVTMRR